MGYYWPIMERDCIRYVKKYLKCQQHSNLFNQPTQALQPMQLLWPLLRWELDLICQISPTSLGGHNFLIIAR